MIFRFNTQQLGKAMESAMMARLTDISESQPDTSKVEVIAFEFPYKLIVKADAGEKIMVWNPELSAYEWEPEKVGKIKEFERPNKAAEQPAPIVPEINPLNMAVDLFMALPDEQRTNFMKTVWSKMGQE